MVCDFAGEVFLLAVGGVGVWPPSVVPFRVEGMKIALAQMLSTKDVARNIETIREYTALAAHPAAHQHLNPHPPILR